MKFKVTVLKNIPKNSWIFDIQEQTAFIGSNVKNYGEGYFEGGWAHSITPFSCSETCVRFGSGFEFKDDEVIFYTPSHALESLYIIRTRTNILVSNSLAYILSRERELIYKNGFSIKCLARPLWRVTEGIKEYPRILLDNSEFQICRYIYSKIKLSKNLGIEEISYKTPYCFSDFSSYKNFLIETIKQVKINSESKEIASYLSTGYDSVACAALAKQAGGNLTVSVTQSRDGVDDSGAYIAHQLKMNSILLARPHREKILRNFEWGSTYFEVLDKNAQHNFEFFCGINFEDEILYTDYDLNNHVVLTGFNGDVLWSINKTVNNFLRRTESSGCSLYEFRLRKGFTHIPVAAILNQISSNIRNITNSDEMKNFILPRTDYNRPIPRRIAEEAGVSRHSFGVSKTAASTMVENLDDFRDIFFCKLMDRYS